MNMRGGLKLALAALAALAAAMNVPEANANEYALERARALYPQLRDANQCEAALPSAREFWPSSDFATLSVEVRQTFLSAVIQCAAGLRDYAQAIDAARAARGLNARWADYLLLLLALDSDDDRLAVESFDAVSARAPHYIDELEYRTVWNILHAARATDPSGASELRVHEALLARAYAPPDAVPDDALRTDHARLLLHANDVRRARERLETVIEPRTLLTIRIDRRFDALRGDPEFDRRFDLVAAAERHIARSREAVAAQPGLLGPYLDLVQALRLIGRNEEALEEVDRILARAQGPDGPSLFEDYEEQLNWLLNERGYILYDLDRREEARSSFGQAIGVGERGAWNVSQVINFASLLQAEGRSREALDVLRTMGQASPYGEMWAAAVRACAGQALSEASVREEAMAFLREHENDNPAALTRGLLCIGDIDGAAAVYIRRLGDPEHRDAALLALQIYEPPPVVISEQEAEIDRRQAAIRERADVSAAVDAVGRIERVPLFPVYWGTT